MMYVLRSLNINIRLHSKQPRAMKQALNDALSIQSLCELATMTVPIQSPAGWASGEWQTGVNLDVSDYQTIYMSLH